VRAERIGVIQYGRYAPLGIEAGSLGEVGLGQHGNFGAIGQTQGQAQAGHSAADDQNVRDV